METSSPADSAWRAFAESLRRFVARHAPHEKDPEDVVQEVFLRLVKSPPKARDPATLRAWLWRATRRLTVDRSRKRSVPIADAEVERVPAPEAGEDDPGRALGRCLSEMAEGLSKEDRDALRHADVEGLEQTELARRLGLSPSGAKSRVQRARRRLKEALDRCCVVERDCRGGVASFDAKHPCGGCDANG